MSVFVENFPFFTVILSLLSAVICYAVKEKYAKTVVYAMLAVCSALSASVLVYGIRVKDYFVYLMGHYPSPFGNEISSGLLEPLCVLLFEIVILLSVCGGRKRIASDISPDKRNLYYTMVCLAHTSLCALCYTNDIFTGYVFIEICTISSCALLMSATSGRSVVAATRYMIFSLFGSGLFLIGVILLYSITGHLLFPQLYESVSRLCQSGEYTLPLTVSVGLMVSGLSIKSGMFPFHFWMPDTYGTATPASSGILSGVISKGYIFLLLKVIFRAVGRDAFFATGIQNVLFVFGICGMIFGSVAAIKAKNVNFMVAYSSAAQIGYIYMGIGLGTNAGIAAAIFQIIAHALTKPLLFLSASSLSGVSDMKQDFPSLMGAGHRDRLGALAFTLGSMSMIGIPIFAGFVPKLLFAESSFGNGGKTYFVLGALAVSTVLNVIYFIRTVLIIYTKKDGAEIKAKHAGSDIPLYVSMLLMCVVNIAVGLSSEPIYGIITRGIEIFQDIR